MLPEGADAFVTLFSESTARALVSVPRGHEKAFTALCAEHGLPYTPLGLVDKRSRMLDVRGLFTITLDELRGAWSATLPALFGGVAGSAPAAPTPPPSASAVPRPPSALDALASSRQAPPEPAYVDTRAPEPEYQEPAAPVGPERVGPPPQLLPVPPPSARLFDEPVFDEPVFQEPPPRRDRPAPTFFVPVEAPEVAEVAEVIDPNGEAGPRPSGG
jgi:hypothetical protein